MLLVLLQLAGDAAGPALLLVDLSPPQGQRRRVLLWRAAAACWCRTAAGRELLCLADLEQDMALISLHM